MLVSRWTALLLAFGVLGCEVAGLEDPIVPDESPAQPEEPPDDSGDPFDWGIFGADRYPRFGAFAGQWQFYTEAEKDTLARYEVISVAGFPEDPAQIHARNPEARVYYRVMPQTIPESDWGRADSWLDVVRRYVDHNDWALRHHNGEEAIVRGWGGYWRWGDFTSECPPGTYYEPSEPELDSRDVNMAQWTAERFIPWYVANHLTGYEGMWWEVVCEEPNTFWFHVDTPSETGGRLDWNRNGIADADEPGFSMWETFVADWDSVATYWMDTIRDEIGYDYPIIGGGDAFAPSLDYFQGFKNEDFLSRNAPAWDWWDEFYTHTQVRPRRGYAYQRDHALVSWNLSINQLTWLENGQFDFSDGALMRQYVRFALGTTLLGDGVFCFYDQINPTAQGQPRNPWVAEYYDLDLGPRAFDFNRRVFGADTLYTRIFHDGDGNATGRVRVNPYDHPVDGVPARDSTIESFR